MKGASKVKRGDSKSGMKPDNTQELATAIKAGSLAEQYAGILTLLADLADNAIRGENIWATFGLTMDKSGLLLTVNWGSDKIRASGGSLRQLSEEAGLLV